LDKFIESLGFEPVRNEEGDILYGKDAEINQILKVNHPIVGKLKGILGIQYNVYVEGREDLDKLLRSRGYEYEVFWEVWQRTFKDSVVQFQLDGDSNRRCLSHCN
jgi:hypothetical protein